MTNDVEQSIIMSGSTGTGLVFSHSKTGDTLTLDELSGMFLEALWAIGYNYATEVEVHCESGVTHGSLI